jgi:hypothetical protein
LGCAPSDRDLKLRLLGGWLAVGVVHFG